jgi:glycerophosphoryl diester phosphodiesterase
VPENTLLAFEHARNQGADGIEFDVRLSGDGTVVVFHDTNLVRMTSGSDARHIAELPSSELCSISLGQGASVPRFVDVLKWAEGLEMFLNVELKADEFKLDALVNTVAEDVLVCASDDLKSRLLFSSFSQAALAIAVARAWAWPLAQLFDHDDDFNVRPANLTRCGIHAHWSLLTDERICRDEGAEPFVNAWTVNDGERARQLALAQVDGIITDEPGLLRDALE